MAVTLLIVAGFAVSLAAAFVVAGRSAVQAATSSDTVVGLSAGPDTMAGGGPAGKRHDWALATVANLTDAEDLMDWTESQGFAERELVVLGNSAFAVRWR